MFVSYYLEHHEKNTNIFCLGYGFNPIYKGRIHQSAK